MEKYYELDYMSKKMFNYLIKSILSTEVKISEENLKVLLHCFEHFTTYGAVHYNFCNYISTLDLSYFEKETVLRILHVIVKMESH